MTKTEKRVAIAKDVIKQIKIGKVIPHGFYMCIPNAIDDNIADALNAGNSCEVCALGAMFAVKAMNHGTSLEVYECNWMSMTEELSAFFSYKQMAMIESAYELNQMQRTTKVSSTDIQASIKFGRKSPEDRQNRMLRIMRNIIRNDGTFVP